MTEATHDHGQAVDGEKQGARGSGGVAPRGVALVLSGALCLSISAVLVKLADVDAATTAVARCALAVIVLVPLGIIEGRKGSKLSATGRAWAVAAGVALGIDYAAWTASIYDLGAGVSTVLINVQVVVLPLLALLIDHERPSRKFLLGLPLMLVGLTLVGGVWETGAQGAHSLRGLALALVAGVGYAVYLFITRRAERHDPGLFVQPLMIASASAALTSWALSLANGGVQLHGITLKSWILLATLAVVGQVVAWLFIHQGTTRLPSVTAGGLLLIQPVLALVLSGVVLGEVPSILQVLGAGVVLLSVAVTNNLIQLRGKHSSHN